MSETSSSPELTKEHEAASVELGAKCLAIINHGNTLSMMDKQGTGPHAERAAKRVESPNVTGMTSVATKITNIELADSSMFEVEMTHTDDATTENDRGAFDIADPYANYRMTFQQVQDAPEGQVALQAFSVEMTRIVQGRTVGGNPNPTSLIVWDLSEPGDAEYLRGVDILNSDQYARITEIATVLAGEEEKLFARALYQD